MHAWVARHFPTSTRVTRPSGGYFLWFEFPEQVDSLQLFQLALAQGISLAPGPILSATRRFRNCARLNYGHPWDAQSERAMEVLGRIIASFCGGFMTPSCRDGVAAGPRPPRRRLSRAADRRE